MGGCLVKLEDLVYSMVNPVGSHKIKFHHKCLLIAAADLKKKVCLNSFWIIILTGALYVMVHQYRSTPQLFLLQFSLSSLRFSLIPGPLFAFQQCHNTKKIPTPDRYNSTNASKSTTHATQCNTPATQNTKKSIYLLVCIFCFGKVYQTSLTIFKC